MITYQNNLTNISNEMLSHFCVGWKYPITGVEMNEILLNSHKFVLALSDGIPIGFVNSLSDGVKFAFIPMLEVLPDYKNKGVGKKLLELLFDELTDIQNIDLTCDEELQAYYEQFGMVKSHGMVFRKYLGEDEVVCYKNKN